MDTIGDEIEEFLAGQRSSHKENRILATIMFTDIVGSTERLISSGDEAWRQLLARHNAIVRRELSRYQGREVKTLGDGFMVVFDGPGRAVRCASAIVEATRSIGLVVRVGLHSGECEVDGHDVVGIAVHIAARVTSEAGPGEVLASRTVKDLVIGSDLRFLDRGKRMLKGLDAPWNLFALAK
ncbi:MAG: adenylate/guanylate cyclase domain-containing protein [Actinobacteria bacterium]|nr:adenylate/guanylate cyclase domain-containing protein [Actinomycetota bacterium]